MSLMDGLFGDDEIASIVGDEAMLAAMLRVEAALARVEGRLGLIPEASATRIAETAEALVPDLATIRSDAASAGIPSQALVKALKSACGQDAGWVHFGATSQDIQDTSLILRLRETIDTLQVRLVALAATLARQAEIWRAQAIPARTRFQIAAPTTLGAKIDVWRDPLARHLERLDELRPRLCIVSFHGAAGTGAALAPRSAEIRRAIAEEVGLGAPDIPWHASRDGLVELGNWLALVTGSLGKMGMDLVLLGQSEVAEVAAGMGGGSSTMPQKSNPVSAEALVSLARVNAGALGTLHQAMVHAQERDGTALGIEWQVLPAMLIRTGAALRIATTLADTLEPRPDRISQTFAADRGAMLAEAAGFALSARLPRDDALDIVGQALRAVSEDPNETLIGALSRLAPDHDWERILDPSRLVGDAGFEKFDS